MPKDPPIQTATTTRQRVVLLVILVVGGLLFTLNASSSPFPGNPSLRVSDVARLTPFVLRSNFIWQNIGRVADLVLPGSLTGVLSGISVAFGVLVLGLLYWFNRISFRERDQGGPPVILSALAATAVLAAFEPFVVAASRPGPGTFDAALILAGAVVTVLCLKRVTTRRLMVAGVLYGLALIETPFALVFLPIGCGTLVIALVRRRRFTLRYLLSFLLPLGIVGAGSLLVFCWMDARHPIAAHWQIDSTMGMVGLTVRQYIKTLLSGIPHVGWLIVVVTSAVPWILLRGALRPVKLRRSQVIFLVSLSVIAIGLFLNLDFAPAAIIGENRYLVLPHVMIASWIGFLLFLLMRKLGEGRSRVRRRHLLPLQWAICLAVSIAATGYGIWNFPKTSAAQGAFLARMAARAVGDLPAGTTMFAGGEYARQLQIAARTVGKDLSIVDTSLMQFTPYQRYLRAQYQSVRQQSLVQMGIIPLFRGLMEESEDEGASLATAFHGELFTYSGVDPLPWGTYYGPGDLASEEVASALTNQVARYWAWFDDTMPGRDELTHEGLTGWVGYLHDSSSKQANNFGVVCQDIGLNTLAFEAYTRSREHNEKNISALLNKYRLAVELESVEADALREQLEEEAKGFGSSMAVWRLASVNGYVRDPFYFRDMGMTWALSGRREQAIQQLEQAAAMGARGGAVRSMLGSLYLAKHDLEKSERQYSIILEHRPNHPAALMGMARLLITKGDFAGAESFLARAEEAGVPFLQVGMEIVALRIASDRKPEAIGLLQQLIKSYPDERSPKVLLSLLLAMEGSLDEATSLLSTISVADITEARHLVLIAGTYRLLRRDGDAEHVLQRALQEQPGNEIALEQLVELRLADQDVPGALGYAKMLLLGDQHHPIAHHVLGLHYQLRGEYDLARNAYEVCLKNRPLPQAMNNLAWLLSDEGDVEGAIQLATRAIKESPEDYSPWDTLGYALLRKGEYDKSAKALLKALELNPKHLEVNLHILELFILQQNMESASKLAGKLQGRLGDLSGEQLTRYQELRERLDANPD